MSNWYQQSAAEILSATLAGGWQGELINHRKDGSEFPIFLSTSLVRDDAGHLLALIGVATDLTERKHSQELYRHLCDAIPNSVLVIDQQRRVVLANRTFLEKNHRSDGETLGRGIHEVFPPGLAAEVGLEDRIHQVFQTHCAAPVERMAYRMPGVPLRIYSYTLVPMMWGGEVENVTLLMDDVTEQTRLGEQVRRTERQLASIVGSASDLVISTDTEGRLVAMNPAFARVSGFSAREAIGRFFRESAIDEHRDLASETLLQVAGSGKTVRAEWSILAATGKAVPVAWVCSPMEDDAGKPVGVVAVGRNLTENRKLEAQLLQSEKLAALGIMASGIAHELRNPLAVASSAAQLIIENSDDLEKVKLRATKIHDGITRACSIIESLLRFTRPSASRTFQPVALGSLVEETLALVTVQAQPQKVAVEIRLAPLPVVVSGEANLLRQVLMNLILNAFNAMPNGGGLQVTLARQEDQAVLEVIDTGRGISESDIGRVFDPFYTTNPLGRGTGLGLSLSSAIVKQHFGSIEVTSGVERGSTFTVRLPLLRR